MVQGLAALAALVLAPSPPPPAEVASRAAIEQRTELDLEGVWEDYLRDSRAQQTFLDFTRARFRRRLGTGIGLSVAGLVLTAGGIGLVLLAATREDVSDDVLVADIVGGTFVLTAGFALGAPGGILWGVNQARLGKLRRAGFTSHAPRLRLTALSPLGLRVAF